MAKNIKIIHPVKQQITQQLRPKKRVCAYCRVSTDSREQHNSFEVQQSYYKDFIENNEDWEFAGIYADEARSGTKLQKREEFLRMLKDCENGRIDMIVTKSITRFARNTVDSIQAIRRLKELDINVYFEKEHINSLSEKSEQLLAILSCIAQGEAENTSTNNRWAAIKRFQDGTFLIGTPAYGYTRNEFNELVIKEEEAVLVRRIFKEYLNGKGTYVIAKELTDEQCPTIRDGEKWDDTVIKGILLNPVYAGNLLLQKTYSTEVVPFKRKHNKGQLPQYYIENNHDPIISTEQAEMVREIMEYRRKQYRLDEGKSQNRYSFSGKLICGECGSTLRRQKIYIGRPYEKIQWCCHQHIEDKTKCGQKAIREDILQQVFILMWNKLVSNYSEMLLPMLEILKKLRMDEQQEHEIEECNQKIMELTEQGHILSRLIAKGYMDPAVFIERQNALKLGLEATKKKRNQLLDCNGFEPQITQTEWLICLIRDNPEITEEYCDDLFSQAVEKVTVQNGRITFHLINELDLTENTREEEMEVCKDTCLSDINY